MLGLQLPNFNSSLFKSLWFSFYFCCNFIRCSRRSSHILLNLHMSVYIPVIFVSALFYAIGYYINKENSKYLLSGYNTMSDDERKKFNIEGYLKIFKPFFKNQALYSFLVFQLFHFE